MRKEAFRNFHRSMIDQPGTQTAAFVGNLLIFLFFLLSASCRHIAGRHNRQVSHVISCRNHKSLVAAFNLACLWFCRYSGSGSSGAASMRKVRAVCDPTVILVNSSLVMATQRVCTHLLLYGDQQGPVI